MSIDIPAIKNIAEKLMTITEEPDSKGFEDKAIDRTASEISDKTVPIAKHIGWLTSLKS
jgi:hypothetical protein